MDDLENIKVLRANKEEINGIFTLSAAMQMLDKMSSLLERRLKLSKYTWRDYKMVQNRLEGIMTKLIKTYPAEKVAGVLPQYKHAIIEVRIAKPAVPEKDYVTLTADDFGKICAYAFEGNCKMCIDGDCNRCELGKAFDRHNLKDRNGRCWSDIGIDGE